MSTVVAGRRTAAAGEVYHRALQKVALVFGGAAIGYVAWSNATLVPLALLLPFIASYAADRIGIYALMFGYFAVGSFGLPAIAGRFFAHPNPLVQYGLPWLLPLLLALPFLLVSPKQAPWKRGGCFALALVLLTVPPLGLLAWRNPLFGAAVLFPGTGLLGILATLALCGVLAALRGTDAVRLRLLRLTAMVVLVAAAGAVIESPLADRQYAYGATLNWAAGDTHLAVARTPAAQTQRTARVVHLLREASALRWPTAVLLPEAAIEPYRPVDEMMLFGISDAAAKRHQAIVFGAVIPAADGHWHDAVMGAGTLAGPDGTPRVLTESRVPMPVGNWHLGLPGGALAHPFGSDAGRIGNTPVAWSICYEDTILWSHWSLLSGHAKALVSLNNDWALRGTRTARIQALSANLLARLAGVPLVSATNR